MRERLIVREREIDRMRERLIVRERDRKTYRFEVECEKKWEYVKNKKNYKTLLLKQHRLLTNTLGI